MPLWDLQCPTCGWTRPDTFVRADTVLVCPDGHPVATVILPGSSGPTMIPDSIPGGRTYHNLGHDPVTVYSQSELKREMQARGLEPFVRHVGGPHTSRWGGIAPETLDGARKLLERVG